MGVDLIPWIAVAILSVLFGLFGHRLFRLYCFVSGFVAGAIAVFWIVSSNTEQHVRVLPVVVGLIGGCVAGLASLLITVISLGAVMGAVVSVLIIVAAANTLWFTAPHRFAVMITCTIIGMLVSIYKKNMTRTVSTAMGGSLLLTFVVDHFLGKTFTSCALRETVLDVIIGVENIEPICGTTCHFMLLSWLALVVTFSVVQYTFRPLRALGGGNAARVWRSARAASGPLAATGHGSALPKYSAATGDNTTANGSSPNSASDRKDADLPHADSNYFAPQRLPVALDANYKPLQVIFSNLQRQFGFQTGSADNQFEHALFLLGNYTSRLPAAETVTKLHKKMLSNYRGWCEYLNHRPELTLDDSVENATELKLYEFALYLLIWGEASSLRHCPEMLCFLYHHMSREMHAAAHTRSAASTTAGDGKASPPAPKERAAGAFLSDVVTPIWLILKNEKGDIHTQYRNYDDMNEFFWTEDCKQPDIYYALPSYDVAPPPANAPNKKIPISDVLKTAPKTYLERRSWLHPARSFLRIITFLMTAFHFLVCLAFLQFKQISLFSFLANQVLASAILTVALLSIVKEMLDIWASYGIILRSTLRTGGFLLRLAVKSGFALYLLLLYIWSFERGVDSWNQFLFVTAIYLTPFALSLLTTIFPSISDILMRLTRKHRAMDQFARLWSPLYRLYVGRNIQFAEVYTYKYQLFWLTLLSWKFYCSYQFQVSPLVDPTLRLVTARGNEPFAGLDLFLLTVLWLPFVLVYFFDTVIWYFVWQAVVGAVVGMQIKLGEVRSFKSLFRLFPDAANEFVKKLIYQRPTHADDDEPALPRTTRASAAGSDEKSAAPVSTASSSGFTAGDESSDRTPLLLPKNTDVKHEEEGKLVVASAAEDPFHNETWLKFARAWNEIVEDLRAGDLLNNEEKHLLTFRFIDGAAKQYYIPLFVTAGVVDHALESCAGAAARFHAADNALKKVEIEAELAKYFTDKLIREAISELWELSKWLLMNLLGQRHTTDITDMFQAVFSFLENGYLLKAMDMQNITKIKPLLLSLVRAVRIAHGTFKSLRDAKVAAAAAAASTQVITVTPPPTNAGTHKSPSSSSLAIKTDGSPPTSTRTLRASAKEDFKTNRNNSKSDLSKAGEVSIGDDSSPPLRTGSRRTRKNRAAPPSTATSRGLAEGLSKFKKSASSATISMLDQMQSNPLYTSVKVIQTDPAVTPGGSAVSPATAAATAAAVPTREEELTTLHVNFLRDQTRALLTAVSGLVKEFGDGDGEGKQIKARIGALLGSQTGFFLDDAYAASQISELLLRPQLSVALRTLHTYLTMARIDAEPKQDEARRRLLFFVNSLFMSMPKAPSVRSMYSWTVLTPFYSEDILYSQADLDKETEDGVSVSLYLQTLYPTQWKNFLERIGASEDDQHIERSPEARLWATQRGQTLMRTVDGMMLYQKALRLLLKLEEPNLESEEIDDVVKSKFQYVVSCQVYGQQKRELDPKATDIDWLLAKNPNLRVAYIDNRKARTATGTKDEFFSVLIKSVPRRGADGRVTNEVREIYRVKLPGNPIIGEGKPENQNHAIIFTRGEMIQAIDMNQAGYFEEALKMRNLLKEFDVKDAGRTATIVGFREHVYTGSLSSIANYMALQEGCFVTLGQRVLHSPLLIRLHYGHPDLFDKMFFMTRGGVSKASKAINLSEDIYAGFNNVLRGGHVSFREYIQVGKGRDVGLQQLFKFEAKLSQGAAMQSLSRDVYRMAFSLDFFRLLSFYYGGIGFYLSNSLTIWALYLFLYSRLFLAAAGLEDPHSFSGIHTFAYWFGQCGFLLTLPIYASLGLEMGFGEALKHVVRMIVTGGPLFFMFHMGTKAHYFEMTLLAGGAKYRPTGRGFVTQHEHFAEIFRFHAASHFYKAFEITLLLLLYATCKSEGPSYGSITWAAWLIAMGWLFAPFWFNPNGFDWERVIEDVSEFRAWMARTEGDGDKSWLAWWKDELSFLPEVDTINRVIMCALTTRHAMVGVALLYYNQSTPTEIGLVTLAFAFWWLAQACVQHPLALHYQLQVRATQAMCFIVTVSTAIIVCVVWQVNSGSIGQLLMTCIGLTYIGACIVNSLLICGVRSSFIRTSCQTCDYGIAAFLMAILGVLSVLRVPAIVQTRFMFNNAFSHGILINQLLKNTKKEEAQKEKRLIKQEASAAAAAVVATVSQIPQPPAPATSPSPPPVALPVTSPLPTNGHAANSTTQSSSLSSAGTAFGSRPSSSQNLNAPTNTAPAAPSVGDAESDSKSDMVSAAYSRGSSGSLKRLNQSNAGGSTVAPRAFRNAASSGPNPAPVPSALSRPPAVPVPIPVFDASLGAPPPASIPHVTAASLLSPIFSPANRPAVKVAGVEFGGAAAANVDIGEDEDAGKSAGTSEASASSGDDEASPLASKTRALGDGKASKPAASNGRNK